jgi:WS/DGAT/MGAT family acyltransferase
VASNTPLNGATGAGRRVEWRNLDLASLEAVKRCLGGTLNDVLLAVVAGALRRYLRERGVPLRGLDFRIVIPVNMRRGPDDASSANRVAAWLLTLPLAERDPRRRLARICRETDRLRASRSAEGIDLLTRLADLTGSIGMTSAGTRLVSALRPYNLIVTNVPGPQRPLYLAGSRVLEIHPQLPLFAGQGLGVAAMSYCGQVCVGLISDRELVPDLERIARGLDEAEAELRDAARVSPRVASAR